MVQIEFPWPPALLSPNNMKHWRVKWKAKKQYKDDCYILAYAAKHKIKLPDEGRIHLHVTFVPPGEYNYDEDNLIARMKYAFDGIADAWGVNDRRFKGHYEIAPAKRPGKVIIEYRGENNESP